MSGHDQRDPRELGPDDGGPGGWSGTQDRLDRLRLDVAAGAPARPTGGARSARRRGVRRRAARLAGTAAAVAAVVVAVPLGLSLGGDAPVDQGLQVATEPVPDTPPSPGATAPPVAPPTPGDAGSPAAPWAGPGSVPTAPAPSDTASDAPVVAVAPTGAVEVDGPPVEDRGALAAATLVELPPSDPDPALAGVGFISPSGGIVCGMGTDASEVHCRVSEAGWSVPRPEGCPGSESDWEASGVSLDLGRGRFGRCATDSVFVVDPPVLDYGTAVEVGDVRCTSLRTGTTCQDAVTGEGFRVSRSAALVW